MGTVSVVSRFSTSVSLFASLVVALIAWPSLQKAYHMDHLLSQTDSRAVAANWIAGHLPEGSRIFQSGTDWAQIELAPSRRTLESRIRQAKAEGKKGCRLKIRLDNTTQGQGYHLIAFDPDQPVWEHESRPEYAVLHETPLFVYSPVPEQLTEWLTTHYAPIQQIQGVGLGKPEWYDQIDAQFLPFSDYAHAQRPGPNITIYRRRDID